MVRGVVRMGHLGPTPAQHCPDPPPPHSLQTEGGDAQGDSGGKLGEEDIEGEEDGLGPMDMGLLQVEVINDVRQHGPVHGGGSREHPST